MINKLKPYLITAGVVLVVLAVLNRLSATNPVKKAVTNS